MCAALELDKRKLRPGMVIRAWVTAGRIGRFVWAGFARKESERWWHQQGWAPVDVPAERFAERSDRTQQLQWDTVPAGLVVRGLMETNGKSPLLKIVTRAASEEEWARFEHARMPLLEKPLFSAENPGVEPDGSEAQPELF